MFRFVDCGNLAKQISAEREKDIVVYLIRDSDPQTISDKFYCNLASKYASLVFYKADVTDGPEDLETPETPAVAFYSNGKEVRKLVRPTKEQIETELEDRAFKEPPRKRTKVERASSESSFSDDESTISPISSKHQPSDSDNDDLKSVSEMKIKTASRLLEFDIDDLLAWEVHKPSELITLRTDQKENLKVLREKCHDSILDAISKIGYPRYTMKESTTSAVIHNVMKEVVNHLRQQLKLKDEQLEVQDLRKQKKFQIKFGKMDKMVKPDILISGKRKDGKTIYYLSVTECKRHCCEEGVNRILIYMKEVLSKLNGDDEPVYGICSNGTHFNLVKYSPKLPRTTDIRHKEFQLLETQRFVFREMVRFKQDWLDSCSGVVDILYSILFEKLQLLSN